MKRNVIILFSIIIQCTLFAQTPSGNRDTIWWGDEAYYLNGNYVTCPQFLDENYEHCHYTARVYMHASTPRIRGARSFRVSSPMAVNGLAAMVPDDLAAHGENPNAPCYELSKLPEYLFLYQYVGSPDTLLLLDSIRWDTASPILMKIPINAHIDEYRQCYVYEVRFKSPIYVDSVFFVGGSYNSNNFGSMEGSSLAMGWFHIPTFYTSVRPSSDGYCPSWSISTCCVPQSQYWISQNYGATWYNDTWTMCDTGDYIFGEFFPIVDNYHLNVYSDSLDLGEVCGGGLFPDQTFDTIRALPRYGCKFTHWNDGSTENPRVIFLTQDTAFTAYFEEMNHYQLSLSTNNPEWGSVEGDGYYPEETPVTITAVPTDSYCNFVQWDDGNWENPRVVYLSSDTAFTAIFERDNSGTGSAPAGAPGFALTPNPVRGTLTLTAGAEGSYSAEVYDLGGRCLRRVAFAGRRTRIDVADLPSGTYLLKLSGDGRGGVRRFVKR